MRFCFCIVVYGALTAAAYAQTPSLPSGVPLTTATVSVAVSFDSTKRIFAYAYTVSNSPQSVGKIDSFDLDISTATGGVALGSDGLINSATGYFANTASVLVSQIENGTLPVGFQSQPQGWHSGPTAQFTASWYGPLPPGGYILPGQSLGSFILTSQGLPGIRRFIVRPAYYRRKFFQLGIDEASDQEALQIVALDKTIRQAIQSQGYTIGPDDPASLEPGSLLDRLISLKHQSVSLDWLRGEEFIKDLDEKLDQARKALTESKTSEARRKLREFIQKLAQQRKEQLQRQHEASEEGRKEREEHSEGDKKFVNDNAFYLLKFNAQFIISKLPAPPNDEDDEKSDKDGGDWR